MAQSGSLNAPQKSSFTGFTKTSYAPKNFDRRAQFMAMSAPYERVDGPTSFGQPVMSSGSSFGQTSIPSMGLPGMQNMRAGFGRSRTIMMAADASFDVKDSKEDKEFRE